jgi:uncharacterized membrane protein
MTAERDHNPLDVLRACNPVPAGVLDDLVLTDLAQAQFRRIVATPRGELRRLGPAGRRAGVPGPVRRRRTLRVAVVAGLATMSVGVAAYALVGRQPAKPQNVACFARADLTARTAIVGVDAGGPVAACARVWQNGYLGGTATPSLRACLLESGSVGVFPEAGGRDVCLDLGLAAAASPAGGARPTETVPQSEDGAVDHTRFFAFRDAVLPRFVGQECIGVPAAEAIVREELDRAGLTDWVVVSGVGSDGSGFSEERPCASLSFLPEIATVALVPLPPAG